MSRLLASILIRSSNPSGSRNEMVFVEDFKFGKDARCLQPGTRQEHILSGEDVVRGDGIYLVYRTLTCVTRRVTFPDVIKTFADRRTRELYITGKQKHFPPDIARRAVRKLEYLDLAVRLEDLRVPPSNRLHALSKKRRGQYSISINDQWRICFRFVKGDAYDVEICDYH